RRSPTVRSTPREQHRWQGCALLPTPTQAHGGRPCPSREGSRDRRKAEGLFDQGTTVPQGQRRRTLYAPSGLVALVRCIPSGSLGPCLPQVVRVLATSTSMWLPFHQERRAPGRTGCWSGRQTECVALYPGIVKPRADWWRMLQLPTRRGRRPAPLRDQG